MTQFKIQATAKKETYKALLVETEQGSAWIALSLIDLDSEVFREGDEGILVIPDWLADEKGWE